MTESSKEIVAGVRQRRRAVVQGFLWTLLGFVLLTIAINTFAFGVTMTLQALAPNLVLLVVVGLALWLNGQDRMEQALVLVIALTLGAVALPLFVNGVNPTTVIVLFVLFLPVGLAGLLLGRTALRLTTGVALAIVLVPTILQSSGRAPWIGPPEGAGTTLASQYAIVLSILAFFLDRFGSTLDRALLAVTAREAVLNREMSEHRQAREALAHEAGFSEAVMNSLPGLFYVIDDRGSYVRWNNNFQHVLGYEPEEMSDLDPMRTISPDDRPSVQQAVRKVGDAGTASTRATLVTKEGERHPYLLTVSPITTGNRTFVAAVGLDTSELDEALARIERLNADLKERLERIKSLHEIDMAITGSLDLDLTLRVILEQVTQRLGVDAASVLLYKPRIQRLRFGAATGFSNSTLRTTDLRLGEGQAGRAALERELVHLRSAEEIAQAFRESEKISTEGFKTYLAVPLVSKGQLQGVLELFDCAVFEPSADWLSFLTTLATQAAIALDNGALFENLERSNIELRLAYDTTIEGWARALDLRDEETEGHSRRVASMTGRLAERLGVSEEKLEHMRRGSLLHDIGKMAVPDSLLLKPGKLTEEEWKVMARHPTTAFELLMPIEFLRPALDIPYAHHERWDGTGYPRRLAGEKIPLAARIFTVVDVFDALTSERPYRKAWSEEKALAYIEEQAGQQFDPAVVTEFLRMQRNHSSSHP